MPKNCTMTKFHIADAGSGGSDRFFAVTDDLDSYATYLNESKTKLDGLLSELKTEMSAITNGWADQDGALFKEKFDSFISEANKINAELETLSSFVTGESGVYSSILADSLRIMDGG